MEDGINVLIKCVLFVIAAACVIAALKIGLEAIAKEWSERDE